VCEEPSTKRKQARGQRPKLGIMAYTSWYRV